MEYKLSEESAQEQIDTLLDYYEIDLDDMDGETARAVSPALKKLTKAIRRGRLEIGEDDNGVITVVQHLKNGDELSYREIDGKAKVAMGTKDGGDTYGRAYALMGSLCGIGDAAIQKLKGPDLSVVECLGIVFLQA